jgi:spore coat polysaccharide biosynthesis protein SpsF
VGLEIFTFAALENSWKNGLASHHREHVNEFILENLSQFKHAVLKADIGKRAPNISLTVDHPEEFAFAEKMYREYFESTGRYDVSVAWVLEKLSQ